MIYLAGCFHFWGMLRASLMWHTTEIQPQELFCFSYSSASLLLIKVGLDKHNNVSVVIPDSGNVSTTVGTQWLGSVFWKHISWGEGWRSSYHCLWILLQSLIPVLHWVTSSPDLSACPLDMMFNHQPDYFGDINNCLWIFCYNVFRWQVFVTHS